MQNLVICCDGTWNTPENLDDGVPAPTNVVRIFSAIAELDDTGQPQHKYYHPGVGTDGSWWERAVAGGTGRGLDRNIMSAYRWLCDHWLDQARVYLFGFSRGAYTVRSLVGFISACGLLKLDGLDEPEVWNRIERLFQHGYRPRKAKDKKKEKRKDWDALGWAFHNGADEMIPIRFLGVWDTVGALGIPDDMAFLNLIDQLRDHSFHDTRLSPAIKTARHAVAMDEMRASFRPTLWTAYPSTDAEQRWFAGAHADVGGGYRDCGLADCALKWMIDEARQAELNFDDRMVAQVAPDPRGVLHDSAQGVFAMLPLAPRSVPRYSDAQALHESARSRIDTPPITQFYRRERSLPDAGVTLDIFARQPWNDTGVWLEAGVEYRFDAHGEWQDGSVTCGPGGSADGDFQLAEVLHLAASALGQFERLFKKVTGNAHADFSFTKRLETLPWFALVGAIANGGVDAKGNVILHETFLIGDGCTYTPKKSGYFYGYANDAWNCYGNNRGRVALKVSRN